MEKLPQLRFVFDRKNVATKSTDKNRRKGLVQIEVLHNRKRKYYSTGVKLYLEQWNATGENHVIKSAYAVELNASLKQQMSELMTMYQSIAQQGNINLADAAKLEMLNITFTDYIQNLIDKNGKQRASTKNLYTYTLSHIAKSNIFGRVRDISYKQVYDFYNYLLARNLSTTTVKTYMNELGVFINSAIRENLLAENPLTKLNIPKGRSKDRVRLTEAELQLLISTNLSNTLSKVRDVFVFQCYTGLAYSDVRSLNPAMFVQENGKWFIERNRTKTQTHYRIMVLPPALSILEKYSFRLPTMCLGNYSTYLKKVAAKCGVKKHLTSHVGRHTFATWALSKGVPIEIVSKMLGHTNIKTTQIYAKILARDVDAQFDMLAGLF